MSHNKVNKRMYPSDVQPISGMNVVDSQHSLANLSQNRRKRKNNLTYNIMNKSNLEKLTKDQLITLLLEKQHPVPKPRTKKMVSIPKPRQSVKQMVKDYENTIIKPPMQFRDGPQPLPRNNIIPPPIQFADKPKAAPRVKNLLKL